MSFPSQKALKKMFFSLNTKVLCLREGLRQATEVAAKARQLLEKRAMTTPLLALISGG